MVADQKLVSEGFRVIDPRLSAEIRGKIFGLLWLNADC